MPRPLATLIYAAFILWMYLQDRKGRRTNSGGLWVAFTWLFILGSRPVSAWLGVGKQIESADDYVEGSALDRWVFLGLIIAGVMVLLRRRPDWRRIWADNKYLFILYLYFAVSTVWSDYPFVSLKRLVKDFGNVIMVLLLITEEDPIDAVKALFVRCAIILVPLSVLFVKYYPDLGRGYDRWTGNVFYNGVTVGGKNSLGGMLVVCGLFVLSDFLDLVKTRPGKLRLVVPIALLAMTAWLLSIANSVTSLACTVFGAAMLIALRLPVFRRMAQRPLRAAIGFGLLALIVEGVFGVSQTLLASFGRDTTLTGRTGIWEAVLNEHTNPLIGVGFYSFWLGKRADNLWQKYWFHPNQAHNGYLETYLNSGMIGVALLLLVLIAGFVRARRLLLAGGANAEIRLTFLTIAALYNWTEAAFNRLGLFWFALIVVLMEFRHDRPETEPATEQITDSDEQPEPAHSAVAVQALPSGYAGRP